MTTGRRPHNRALHLLSAAAVALALAVAGCGGDDDPAQPGSGRATDDFDQATAISQAQAAAPQAVALVQSMTSLAAGFTKDGEKAYAWNAETGRWEYDYYYEAGGTTYDWFYTVQYLGAGGQPQQSPLGAVSVAHDMSGIGSYHYAGEGVVFDYDYVYEYATTIAGLGTGTLVMTGGGGQDIDYTYESTQGDYAYTFAVDWEILAPGIGITGGGCPTGTIRYDYAPFYALVEFDGTGTATSTLYDARGDVVPGGGGSHPLSCATH